MAPEQPWQRTQKIRIEERAPEYPWFKARRSPLLKPLRDLRPGECYILLPPKRRGGSPWVVVIGRDTSCKVPTSPVEFIRDEAVGIWKRRDRRRA